MTLQDPPRFWLGLLLTLVAGWVAAAGFLEFGGIYVSFMSGNTVQVGLGAAGGDTRLVTRPLAAIACFVLGGAIGSALAVRAPRWTSVLTLALEATALAGAACLFHLSRQPSFATIGLLAFAMGAQNQIVGKGRADNAGTTFVTGTLFRLGDAIGRGLAGGRNPVPWQLFLAVSVTFGAGAAGGVATAIRMPELVFVAPALAVALLAAIGAALQVSGHSR